MLAIYAPYFLTDAKGHFFGLLFRLSRCQRTTAKIYFIFQKQYYYKKFFSNAYKKISKSLI